MERVSADEKKIPALHHQWEIDGVGPVFSFLGQEECRVKHLRLQRQLFREDKRELSQKEYQKLIATAYAEGKKRLGLLMETICSTGIRVSEVRYITLEAV